MTPEQLKASILQRAMEGKLVPQNPNDEPASELLKRIKAEKEKLISEGKIKRDKKETEIFRGDDGKHYEKFADGSVQEIDVPYDIPENWEWVKLGSIGIWNSGATPPKANCSYYSSATIPWLLTGDLTDSYITNIPNKISELALKETSVKVNPTGSILIAMYGATVGKLGILTFPATTNQACCACSKLFQIEKLYLFYFLMAERNNFKFRAEGGAQPNISKNKIINTFIPLPPLSEQQRIIEAIESALEKVDEYAESYNKLERLDKEFPDKLKKSILQYAMQGKLVEQDPNDESVEVLLEKIRSEKQKLFEEGKIKKKDLEISIVSQGDDNSYYLNNIKIEIDFPRRSTWLLAPLEKIVTTISAKPYQIKQSEIVKEGKIPVVSQSKILVEGFSNNFSKILDYKTDVVIFGDHTRNLKIIDFPFVVGADGVKILSPICLSAKFLKYHLDYTLLFVRNRGYARHYSYLKSKIIGIPSVLEQKRIVAKIDLLFQKVSQLFE
ncbi:restriction endonuclease subunit S [Streptococcus mitis]|uniref:restriction endonuclease subunit S n=1 Tax=Streptococcus mitis TaxID=28037 RepID=UPI002000B8A2|nr:restriction endonuclease subunit S [Streptococcus mitis]